jgi:predicted Zn-dependent peptidase
LAELAQQPISPTELQRYQRLLCNEAAYSTELSEQLAAVYGYYDLVGQLSAAWEYPQHILSLHPTAIRTAAAAYLQFNQSVVTLVRPSNA